MTSQQAAPDSVATQIVSALPLARITRHRATAAPWQTGSNNTAMISLHNFGTRALFEISAAAPAKCRGVPDLSRGVRPLAPRALESCAGWGRPLTSTA